MVNLVGKVPPLEASGAAVTLVHPTATTVVGQWDVTYPQDMPDEQRPDLGPTRTFGYAHRLVEQPPRFARRHVRRDVQIDARDKNGWSNAEAQIDSAARELSGDVVFQRTLTRDDLGVLVPNVDFKQGDVLPLLVWGMIVPATCTSIRYALRDGSREVEVGFGPSLMADTAGLAENMQQIDRQMRAEAAGIDEYLAKQLDEAMSKTEERQKEADLRQEETAELLQAMVHGDPHRELTGTQFQAQQQSVNEMVSAFTTKQVDVNTGFRDLFKAQAEVNRLNDAFKEETRERQQKQQALDDKQTAMLLELERLRKDAERRRPRPIFAKFSEYKSGYTDPEGFMKVTPYAAGDRGFRVECLGSWTGEIIVRATAFGPLSSNSIDSYRVPITTDRRTFYGTPEAAQMSYIALDMTVFPD